MIVGSEHSSRNIFERLARKELHGQIPQIMHYSKQALSQFEAQARKGGELPQNGNFRERDRDGTFWFSFHQSAFCFFLGLGMRDLVRVKVSTGFFLYIVCWLTDWFVAPTGTSSVFTVFVL